MAHIWLPEDINKAIETLLGGGIILYPTDTIWGVGCDATNEEAISKIYALKKRDANKPLLILVDSIEMLKEYVVSIHPRVETLLTMHERPLTIIYPKARNLPSNLVAANGSIGIRITKDEYCREIISRTDKPLVSTSANVAGEPSPARYGEISSEVIRGVDYVCKYRQHETGDTQASIVARYDKKGHLEFLRE